HPVPSTERRNQRLLRELLASRSLTTEHGSERHEIAVVRDEERVEVPLAPRPVVLHGDLGHHRALHAVNTPQRRKVFTRPTSSQMAATRLGGPQPAPEELERELMAKFGRPRAGQVVLQITAPAGTVPRRVDGAP